MKAFRKLAVIAAAIFIIFSKMAFCQPIEATTKEGKEVILNPDGSWEYKKQEQELQKQTSMYNKPLSATTLIKGGNGSYGIWIDEKRWKFSRKSETSDHDLTFTNSDRSIYAITIHEGIPLPIEFLKFVALENMQKVAINAEIVYEEKRVVNDKEILCMIINATLQSLPFTYYGYYYSGTEMSLQVLTYTISSVFEKHKDEMTMFLNGLVILSEQQK